MTATIKSLPVVVLILIAVVSGCATAPHVKSIPGFASPEEALVRIAAGIPADVAVQARADIRMTTGEGLYPMRLAVLMQRPASLRLEAIPLFGPPAFFLSMHEKTLKVFLAETRAFYIGPATAVNIARYLPLKMVPQDLIAVLTGICPLSHGPDTILQGRPEGDYYRIDMTGTGQRKSLWVRMTDGFLERLEVHQDHHRSYQVRYEEPLRVGETVLPQKITFVSDGMDGMTVNIRYRNIQFLKDAAPGLFDLETPPGVTPVYLD
jgi:hypothetical protein